ncbi:hypothetical protein PMAYCL1PPCAC_11332, partial [Pristionchus mayeri]
CLLDRLDFSKTRKWLLYINGGYLVLAFILIATGWYTHNAAIVTSVSIAGGIIAAGVFLAAVSLLGIYGTREQHQAALFFYMIILFVVFVVQCSVALACLGEVSPISLEEVISAGWKAATPATVYDAERAFGCCGLRNAGETTSSCEKLTCYSSGCPPCLKTMIESVGG